MFHRTAKPTPKTKLTIDLNADLGEGIVQEENIMNFISSANIACGGHTGDASTMRESLRLAAVYGVSAGAHPGFPDRVGFGRREMQLSPAEVTAVVREQLEDLKDIARKVGVPLRHVKPHGMLYTLATRDPAIAVAIARAVASSGIKVYYGLAGANSLMLREAANLGLKVIGEAFADRAYTAEGTLVARDIPGAVLGSHEAVVQGLKLARLMTVTAITGEVLRVPVQTICLHGDGEEAAEVSRELRRALDMAGVRVVAPEG